MCLGAFLPATLSGQTVVVVQEGPGKVAIVSAQDPANSRLIDVGAKPHELELSPDGRTAYVSNFGLLEANHKVGQPGTTISVIDIARGVERTRYSLPAGATAPHGVKLRPNKFRELFTNTEEGREEMIVFDAASGAIRRSYSLPPGVHNFLFNPDGSALFAFTMKGELFRIDPDSGKVTAHATVPSPRGLAWTAGATQLLVSGRGQLLFVDPATLSVDQRFINLGVGQIFYPTATSDSRWILAPAVIDGVLLVVDAKTGAVAHRIETGSPLLAALTPDGKHAWISNVFVPEGMFGRGTKQRNGGVAVLDLETFQTTVIPGISDTNGLAVATMR
jgi:DNA-binding beta-propeller fold protein YncE